MKLKPVPYILTVITLFAVLFLAYKNWFNPKAKGYLSEELTTNVVYNFKMGFPSNSDVQVLTSRTAQVTVNRQVFTNYLDHGRLVKLSLATNEVSNVETNWNPPGLY